MVTRKPKILTDKNLPMKHKHWIWDNQENCKEWEPTIKHNIIKLVEK